MYSEIKIPSSFVVKQLENVLGVEKLQTLEKIETPFFIYLQFCGQLICKGEPEDEHKVRCGSLNEEVTFIILEFHKMST